MVPDFIYCCPFFRIYFEHNTQKTYKLLACMLRNLVFCFLNFLIYLILLRTIERKVSKTHCVKNYSCTPNINFWGIIRNSKKYLRSSIARTSTGCFKCFPSTVNITQTKVNNLYIIFIVQKDILWFKISMCDPHFL